MGEKGMKMKASKIPVVLTIAAALISGCSSPSYEKAATTSTSLQSAAGVIDKSNVQIDMVLAALSELVTTPGEDLETQFRTYSSLMEGLQSLSDDVREKAGDMQTAGAAYFQQWDDDLANISNEDIRTRSTERKNEVSARFERLRASYQEVNSHFAPFMSDLKDIHTALSSDLTAAGLASIEEVLGKANKDAVALRGSLAKLSKEFRELGVSLAATTPHPAN
jgi:chromosome segregation ATPase